MNVVGLDLSLTCTGFASETGFSRTIEPGKLRSIERIAFVKNTILNNLVMTGGSPVVGIEGYAFSSRASHAHELGELGGVVRYALWERGIAWVDVSPSTVKAYATGKGSANKNEMLVAAGKRLGYEGTSNDEADALWVRACLCDALGQPVVEVPTAHRKFLDKLDLSRVGSLEPQEAFR